MWCSNSTQSQAAKTLLILRKQQRKSSEMKLKPFETILALSVSGIVALNSEIKQ